MVKDVWKSENFKDNKVENSARSEKKFKIQEIWKSEKLKDNIVVNSNPRNCLRSEKSFIEGLRLKKFGEN